MRSNDHLAQRMTRWVALAVGVGVLAIVGTFVAAVIWPPPPPAAAADGADGASGARRVSQMGRWSVTTEVLPTNADTVAIDVAIADAQGRPADPSIRPTAALRMTDMAMGTQSVTLAPDTPGRWRGSARLSMSGGWQLELDVEGDRLRLPFTSPAR